ncbi:MAG TPA: hypothetical protein VEK35_06285 [Roseiarcus sp.]|nr:hypothetical protein [Roseiarcus sp.]
MSENSRKSGIIVSGLLHGALLAAILVGFSGAPKFSDATESVQVESVTQDEFNQIMKGERDAKPAEKPVQPAEAATPTPPVEPPKSEPPPKADEADREPAPQAAPTPPSRPAPSPREAATPPTPPQNEDAEVDRPQARVSPQTPPTPPAPPLRPKADDKWKPDQVAKILDEAKNTDQPKPPAHPKLADARVFDPNGIAKLLGQSKPRNADPTASPTSLGLPNQNAQRLSPSIGLALDSWLADAYKACWNHPITKPDDDNYEPRVRVILNADGSLAAPPVLLNPPDNPEWRGWAESAVRAVQKCNPLQAPPQYAAFFDQWRRTLEARSDGVTFDPREEDE